MTAQVAAMRELIEVRPEVVVQESEYKRLLGYPVGHELEGRSRELADFARDWYTKNGRPWLYGRLIERVELPPEQLVLGASVFRSKQLHDLFAAAGAHAAMVVAVSAGPECEAMARKCWEEGKPDEYFFLEMFGSAVVENLIVSAGGRICGWAEQNGMSALPHYSPGYSGWDVADQHPLWDLIRPDAGRALPGELEVMHTGMLRPKKSLLAVFGITRDLEKARGLVRHVPCENCSLPGCPYRRAPYKHFLPQIEDVHKLQADLRKILDFPSKPKSMLDHQAKYSTNERALRKWSADRLRLQPRADGSIEALFRYEGTTCSNMGRALEFDYRVVLSGAESGHRILEATCAPAPEDEGYKFMCEYIADAETFMARIGSEKPMVGKPLNDVLAWKRVYNPSACYCAADSREHKWGLVFEVIHHTLVEREKAAKNGQTAGSLP